MLKTEYKYGQYCTPLCQSDCRYFFCVSDKAKYLAVKTKIKQQYKLVNHHFCVEFISSIFSCLHLPRNFDFLLEWMLVVVLFHKPESFG